MEFDESSFEQYCENAKTNLLKDMYTRTATNNVLSPDNIAQLVSKNVKPTIDTFKYDYRVDSSGKFLFKKQSCVIKAILRNGSLLEEVVPEEISGA